MTTNDNDGLVVLAVDDEEPALQELAFLLDQDPRVGTVLRANDSISALRILTGGDQVSLGGFGGTALPNGLSAPAKQSDVDVLFLDIRMPGLDGLELAQVLSRYVIPPAVVFVTAHDDRAVEAFDVGAVDYLLKPLRPERLYASLSRILSTRGTTVSVEPAAEEEGDDEVIPVELAGTTKLVQRSTVRWVEAQGDYARLHTTEGSHLVRIPLSVLEERWSDAGFVRIHRSYLVALPLITELRLAGSGYVVRLGSGADIAELPVSRRHTRELKDRLVRSTKQAWGRR